MYPRKTQTHAWIRLPSANVDIFVPLEMACFPKGHNGQLIQDTVLCCHTTKLQRIYLSVFNTKKHSVNTDFTPRGESLVGDWRGARSPVGFLGLFTDCGSHRCWIWGSVYISLQLPPLLSCGVAAPYRYWEGEDTFYGSSIELQHPSLDTSNSLSWRRKNHLWWAFLMMLSQLSSHFRVE